MSRALTAKPARSWERMTVLPRVRVAKSSTAPTVSGAVWREVTTSTSGSTGTGLKKCRPRTRSARWVAMPRRMTGREEVLLARTASGVSTMPHPPLGRRLRIDENDRTFVPYSVVDQSS